MKNVKLNSRVLVIIAFFSVCFSSVANASIKVNELPVSVAYYNTALNVPVFQLSFTNEKIEEYQVVIKDKFSTIYTETLNGKGLIRKYQFVGKESNYDLSEDDTIRVEVTNVATNTVVVFVVHPNSRVETETALIAKL